MFQDWKERESLGGAIDWEVWNIRMKRIYNLIAGEITEKKIHSVMDLGAGQMYLRELLPSNVDYCPVDYISLCSNTIVCDFNKGEFPERQVDVIVAAGLLHYVSDLSWLFKSMHEHCRKKLIITYTPTELEGDIRKREDAYLWKNHCSFSQMCRIIYDSGFLPVHVEKGNYDGRVEQEIFVLEKSVPAALPQMVSCTGCGVCAMLCPTGALEMSYDKEGFLKPVFNSEQCIACGKCLKSCPVIHFESDNTQDVESYAVWAPEKLRLKSSSGGAFSLIAEEILRRGGAVCGARYLAENHMVEHTVIRRQEELSFLRGSKYVQSDVRTAYAQIRVLLENENIPVLFSGCPCQVAGLYAYLGRQYDNFYTVDVLCAGVTAPKLFERYLKETYEINKIQNVNCRTKHYGWNPLYITVEFADGSSQTTHRNQDAFEKLFHSFAGLRKCCYQCCFAQFPRQADLTMGDFWGVQNFDPTLDDQKGTSFVCINNNKGRELLASIREAAALMQPVPWQYTGTNRLFPFLTERVRMPATRDYFYHLLETQPYREAAERAVDGKYDVGVLCNWSGDNYGAQLTQYAFYRALTNMGLKPVMIERPDMPYPGGNARDARLFRKNPYPSYAMYPLFKNLDEMRAINELADTFVVPSDQLWNALFAEKDLFALGYIANNKRKISYATSFGCDPHNWSEDERAREAFFLQQLDAVSVREDSAIEILRDFFGVEGAERTLDPVFLHDFEFYSELCQHSQYLEQKDHLAAFILDPDSEKELWIENIRGRLRLESIQICDVNTSAGGTIPWGLPIEDNIRVEDLLAVIKNSKFVVTDSFHGVCIAILFRKPFLVWGNVKRGLTRFQSLLSLLRLEERLVDCADEVDDTLLHKEIDYEAIMGILKRERERSQRWLKNALETPKQASLTTYDILDREQVQIRQELVVQRERSGTFEISTNQGIGDINAELLRINQRADMMGTELLKSAQGLDEVNAELLQINQRADAARTEMLKNAHGLDAVNAELLRVNQRADAAGAELLKNAHGLDAVNAELLRVNQRADAAGAELLKNAHGLDAVNAELLRVNQRADAAGAELLKNAYGLDAVNAELLHINEFIDTINAELLRINQRADIAARSAAESISVNLSKVFQYINIIQDRLQQGDLRIEMLEDRLAGLEQSFSYRLGRVITWIPRKIKGFFKGEGER